MSDVQALIRRLRSPRRVEQRQAAMVIAELAYNEALDCDQLVAAGCLPPLV